MKKRILNLLLGGLLLCYACQPGQKQTVVTGTLTGIESDTLILLYSPISDLRRRPVQTDTIALQQGTFTSVVKNDSVPVEIYLYAKPCNENDDTVGKSMRFVLFPGETVVLSGSLDDYRIEGSAFQESYQEILDQCKPYEV